MFESVRETIKSLQDSASVERVYGEPIAAEGKTLIPVARVMYGFGGGFGSGETAEEGEAGGEGGGVGGGIDARPVGVLEVTADTTQFIRFNSLRRAALAVGVGLLLGGLLSRRRGSRE